MASDTVPTKQIVKQQCTKRKRYLDLKGKSIATITANDLDIENAAEIEASINKKARKKKEKEKEKKQRKKNEKDISA